MITILAWIVFIIGIMLSLVSVKGMITKETKIEKVGNFIGGVIYLLVVYLSAFDIFIR